MSKKDKIVGLGRLCSFDPKCEEDEPCKRCLEIGMTAKDKAVFTQHKKKKFRIGLTKTKI